MNTDPPDESGFHQDIEARAERGDVDAQLHMAAMKEKMWIKTRHRDWHEGMRCFEKAVYWYCKAAANGNLRAMRPLAKCLSKFKIPGDKNFSFRRICGEHLAEIGINVTDYPHDKSRTIWLLFERAAQDGDVDAMIDLADFLRVDSQSEEFQHRALDNRKAALDWYREAAAHGSKVAARTLREFDKNGGWPPIL